VQTATLRLRLRRRLRRRSSPVLRRSAPTPSSLASLPPVTGRLLPLVSPPLLVVLSGPMPHRPARATGMPLVPPLLVSGVLRLLRRLPPSGRSVLGWVRGLSRRKRGDCLEVVGSCRV
jgi:hypothetical protein